MASKAHQRGGTKALTERELARQIKALEKQEAALLNLTPTRTSESESFPYLVEGGPLENHQEDDDATD